MAGTCFAAHQAARLQPGAHTGWGTSRSMLPAAMAARRHAGSRRKAQAGRAHNRARPQGRQAHSKGRTSAGKDAAGNPHGHPANRTRGETGGTADKEGGESREENSKGGRPGAGQYCQSLYCGGQKPCSCAGSGRWVCAVHRPAHLLDCSGGRLGVRYFLFG